MVQEEQNILSILSEPLKIAGFDIVDVNITILNNQKTIQLYIDSPKGVKIDDCINVNQISKNIFVKTNQHYNDYVLAFQYPFQL